MANGNFTTARFVRSQPERWFAERDDCWTATNLGGTRPELELCPYNHCERVELYKACVAYHGLFIHLRLPIPHKLPP